MQTSINVRLIILVLLYLKKKVNQTIGTTHYHRHICIRLVLMQHKNEEL